MIQESRRWKAHTLNLELIELAGDVKKAEISSLNQGIQCNFIREFCLQLQAESGGLIEALQRGHDVAFKSEEREQWLEAFEAIAKFDKSETAEAALFGGKLLLFINKRRNRDLIRKGKAPREARREFGGAKTL